MKSRATVGLPSSPVAGHKGTTRVTWALSTLSQGSGQKSPITLTVPGSHSNRTKH